MNAQRYEARRDTLRAAMRKKGLSALLVSYAANRFYLSGFELHDEQLNESAGYLLLTADGNDWLCTDPRYLDAARRLWPEERVFIYSGDAAGQLNTLIKDKVRGTVGFEAKTTTLTFFDKFSPGLALERADGMVEALRIIKEPEEIELMRRSAALNHRMMEWLPSVLAPGRTEKEIGWDIEKFFRENGASGLSFPCIVGAGTNGALPHYRAGNAVLTENCPILVDVGARLDLYCSDQTRTFWVGDTRRTTTCAPWNGPRPHRPRPWKSCAPACPWPTPTAPPVPTSRRKAWPRSSPTRWDTASALKPTNRPA